MGRLNVVRVIVPSRSTHSLRLFVLGDDLPVIVEEFSANRTAPVLFDNLRIKKHAHCLGISSLPVPSGVVRIVHTGDAPLSGYRNPVRPSFPLLESESAFSLLRHLPPTAEEGTMDDAEFAALQLEGLAHLVVDSVHGDSVNIDSVFRCAIFRFSQACLQ